MILIRDYVDCLSFRKSYKPGFPFCWPEWLSWISGEALEAEAMSPVGDSFGAEAISRVEDSFETEAMARVEDYSFGTERPLPLSHRAPLEGRHATYTPS